MCWSSDGEELMGPLQCHEGACGECEEVREKRCFCGKDMVVEACGAGMDERVECCRPGEEERWDGEWSCAKDCEA